MSKLAVRVTGLGKCYRIGSMAPRHDNIRDALVHAISAPFRNLKDLRRLAARPSAAAPERDRVWALRDVSFEVRHGEVLGIVGRNGAGKSTLLKVLSRITEPSTGRAEVYGRIGSLLEVGTGFHPELTGRENIYLNGSILGMDRAYIRSKFDEIVDFSGVDQFIDTPVKRYSSGMYLRLAFAVAAYLEPEVLIVDEVLAVGDAEFQRKCLGRMSEVAREGRTVLFVSHNMGAVRALCSRALLIRGGELVMDSVVDEVVGRHLAVEEAAESVIRWSTSSAPQADSLRFTRAGVVDHQGDYAASLECRNEFFVEVEYQVLHPINGLRIGFMIQTADGITICGSNDPDAWPGDVRPAGQYTSRCRFPGYLLNAGRYAVTFAADCTPYTGESLVSTPACVYFNVEDTEGHGPRSEKLPGILRPRLSWEIVHRVDVVNAELTCT
jgi:lipopolysaccharide transport system ATP-binding protein